MHRSESLRRLTNEYPPLKGAGIEITEINEAFNSIHVRMPLTSENQNIVKVHFGGSLYAMCDPFFMFILMENLGPDYMVWDKEAHVKFLQPGKEEVFAHFFIPLEQIDQIRKDMDNMRSHVYTFEVDVKTAAGDVVAHIDKWVYVRKMRSADKEKYSRNISFESSPS